MSIRFVQLLLAVTVGCFFIASAYISHLIAERQNALQAVARYDLAFSVGQALSEFTRLKERVAAYGIPGGGVDREEVQLRLDILFSRLDSLRSGEMLEFVEEDPGRIRTIGALDNALEEVQARVATLNRASEVGEIYAALLPLDAEMADLASAGHQTGTRRVAEDQKELFRLHSIFTALAFGLIICGVSLIFLLMWQNSLLGRAQKHLHRLAHYDSLTGLANRVLFADRLAAKLSAARNTSATVAVLCLDLDRFKEVNDTLGHHVGDKVLKAVAGRLEASVGPLDVIARLGGDEFAVVAADLQSSDQCAEVAARIIEAISSPYEIEGHEITVGVSIGVSSLSDGLHDSEELLKHADLALYHAKANGKGTFHFFAAEMDDRLQARKSIEADLRKALSKGEMEVYYQPIVDANLYRISGFEALIRWRHPLRGMISPGEFIPIAEDTGMITMLGEWVLRQACEQAASWPADLRVAVNLSPAQFREHALVMSVVSALAVSGLSPNRLELEITETVLLEESEATLRILHQLRTLGVRIAMDDFGTGYSSLSYLRRFPFNKIKIDQSFVRDLLVRADSLAIVQAIASLGRTLGMTTTAEGVETEEQFAQLKDAGCDEVQGFYFARPMPVSELRMVLPPRSELRTEAA